MKITHTSTRTVDVPDGDYCIRLDKATYKEGRRECRQALDYEVRADKGILCKLFDKELMPTQTFGLIIPKLKECLEKTNREQ